VSSALDRLKNLTAKISSYELSRKENLKELERLYEKLHVNEKVSSFGDLFEFKAINLSGVSLNADDLGTIKEKKYVQIIAITYDKSSQVKNKNSSLGYFGRAEKIDGELKNEIIAFILRWRFEKSFITLEHYHTMINGL
jgi:phosphoglucomutase